MLCLAFILLALCLHQKKDGVVRSSQKRYTENWKRYVL